MIVLIKLKRKDFYMPTKVLPRRTFAIISHPDAGKTTLTEKLLFFGGSIRSTGTVKAKKSGAFATSDWMEIEKQRGISVTSSVMQLVYNDININIVDTPGHQDFSEDTYRTLTAVDTAVMVIDSTKGIEAQTLKLFKVCKMRGIPIITFINKLDREGKEPLDLLGEIEEKLQIETYSINYPVGMGKTLKGIYNRLTNLIEMYHDGNQRRTAQLDQADWLPDYEKEQLKENILLLNEAGNMYSLDKINNGEMTPVFFGSAISNFGVQDFLDHFVSISAPPQPRQSSAGLIHPDTDFFSGFIFKVQANMNPKHRDRIAFLRVCSGVFEKSMEVTLARTGKKTKIAQSHHFFASERETVDKAYPGDIIGFYDPGTYQVGDTLLDGKDTFHFKEMPQFPPEMFAKVIAKNALKNKHFYKGVSQLVQEGTIQLFRTPYFEDYILGAVGELQFQVFEYRMKHEYNVDIEFTFLKHQHARWLEGDLLDDSMLDSRKLLIKDHQNRHVILFENEFTLRMFEEKYPTLKLSSGWHISN
ncbi:peptide chain release factor 3 [Alkalihalophilus pseudofirmus]|nr:peptide chain release factor 3 [Alkalihalophilus pseudofirmus]